MQQLRVRARGLTSCCTHVSSTRMARSSSSCDLLLTVYPPSSTCSSSPCVSIILTVVDATCAPANAPAVSGLLTSSVAVCLGMRFQGRIVVVLLSLCYRCGFWVSLPLAWVLVCTVPSVSTRRWGRRAVRLLPLPRKIGMLFFQIEHGCW